jgi:transcription initiation factor TFIID TATA-box-binding protein
MVDLKIENVIAAAEFETNLDLKKIADNVDTADYNPEQFPGLIYKLRKPKTLTLMFSKGHCVCSGATSIANAKAALTIIYKKLKDLEVIEDEKPPKIKIRDIITSYQFENTLDLVELEKKLPASKMESRPDNFPGLIYKDDATEIKVLIFGSGKVVGYGSPELIELEQLLTELEKYYT